MAATVSCIGRFLIEHQSQILFKVAYQTSLYPCTINLLLSYRHFAAAVTKPARKILKKDAKEKTSDEQPDDREKMKSCTYVENEFKDDVYLKCLYPRQIYEVEKAIHLLKFQVLDFTNPKQGVYLDVMLDMA